VDPSRRAPTEREHQLGGTSDDTIGWRRGPTGALICQPHLRASRSRLTAFVEATQRLATRARSTRPDATPNQMLATLHRVALSAIDLRRRPPGSHAGSLREALKALPRRRAPRRLPFVVIKRINPRFGSLGHWWIEIDGVESYGWWPTPTPVRLHRFILGTRGTLNASHGPTRYITDPHHLDPADHVFHPVLVVRKSDRKVRQEIRKFAKRYREGWRWRAGARTRDCRRFQLRLFDTVGLAEEPAHRQTRGRGCPFLRMVNPRPRSVRTFDVGTLTTNTPTK
jgi:hypothetical protein